MAANTNTNTNANPFLLAADNPAALLELLRSNPSLASAQDDHGYSLVHAAASYDHFDLLRALVREHGVDVNLRDEDEETALFVIETVAAARVLVEELGADTAATNADGQTAAQKIAEEGDYPAVAEYLRARQTRANVNGTTPTAPTNGIPATEREEDTSTSDPLPPVPDGLRISMTAEDPANIEGDEVDPALRRMIEQLAQREDFHTEAGQAELRRIVGDAVAGGNLTERNVRPRQD